MTMRATRRFSTATRIRRHLLLAGTALGVLAVSGCGENRPFEKEANAVRGSKLIVPTSITPPVRVAEVDGAPDDWKMNSRVAEALRVRDIPASSVTKSDSAYVLRGAIKNAPSGRPGQMQVTWVLYDPGGRKVGEVTQSAALPRGQGKTPNDGVVEAMADAAAESIAPIVPSSSVAVADGAETGEAKPNERAEREDKTRVTAIGRMKAESGLAKNFADRAAGKNDAKDAAKPGAPKNAESPAARTGAAEKPSVTERAAPAPRKADEAARGNLPTGGSALSRNLFRDGETASLRPPPDSGALPPPPPRAPAPARADRPMTEIFTAEDDTGPSGDPGSAERAGSDKAAPPERVAKAEPPKAEAPKAEAPKVAPPKTEPAAKTETAGAEPPRDTVQPKVEPAKRETEKPAARAPAAKPVAAAAEPRGTRYWVQIGAHKTAAEAEGQWSKAAGTAKAAGAAQHRILRVDLGARGVFHRLQVGPYADREQATKICAALKAGGLDCFLQGEAAAPPARIGAAPAPSPVAAAKSAAEPKPIAPTQPIAQPKPVAAAAKPEPVHEAAILPDEKPEPGDEAEPVRVGANEHASVEPAAAVPTPRIEREWLGEHELAAWPAEAGAESAAPAAYRIIGTPTIVPIAPAPEAPISALPEQRAAAGWPY